MGSIGKEQQSSIKVEKPTFSSKANTLEYAQSLDAKDHMRRFRDQFIIPSKANIKAKKLSKSGTFAVPFAYFYTPQSHDLNLIIYQVFPMKIPFISVEIV